MGFWSLIDPAYAFVRLPKEVIIENRRLGGLFRLLQVGAFCWVSYNFIYSKAWNVEYQPVLALVELWPGGFGNLGSDSSVKHCTQMSYYKYDWSSTFSYEPTKCMPLDRGEQVQKLGNKMYIPTYIEDTYKVGGVSNYTTRYFAQNVEMLDVYFNHGYEVVHGDTIQRGRDKFNALEGKTGEELTTLSGEESQMLTIFQNAAGSKECSIGGKKRWKQEDLKLGIYGSVSEYLACAGITLDDYNSELKHGGAGESGEPTYRVSGLVLEMKILYHNADMHDEDFKGSVAYIRIRKLPMWNSNFMMAYGVVPRGIHGITDPAGSYRFRYQYGMTIEITAAGKFSFFDYQALITGIVNALVLLALPINLVKMCALYLCGPSSVVYKRVQAEPLDISKTINAVCARKCVSLKAFKLLAAEASDPDAIEGEQLQALLFEALKKMVDEGVLDREEISNMSKSVLAGLDQTHTGSIGVTDFVEACGIGEPISSGEIAALFDEERRAGLIESFFTDYKMRNMLSVKNKNGSRQASKDNSPAKASMRDVNPEAQTPGGGEYK